jgi:tripartite-type tricarboxylate transporter receptor subunit TctC
VRRRDNTGSDGTGPLNDPVRRRVVHALALAGAVTVCPAGAQSSGDAKLGDVRLIVPYPEHGATDRLGRLLATFLERYLDATVSVVNLPGMGGVTGMDAVATAAADGRTLGLAVSTPIVSATLLKRPRAYDVFRDFDWLGIVGTYANAMTVAADAPATLAAWIEWARTQRRPLRYASAGTGTAAHFTGEFLRQSEGLDLVHEAFTAIADAYPKLDDRSIAVVFDSVQSAIDHQTRNRRIIAVTSLKRHPRLPDVPALAETFPGQSFLVWAGVVAPPQLPAPLRARIGRAVAAALNDSLFRSRLVEQGVEVVALTGERAVDFVEQDFIRKAALLAKLPPAAR